MTDPLPPKVFTPEQEKQLMELCARIQRRAVEKGVYQTITIQFNAKGHPTHFSGTDNERAIVPNLYKAE